MFQVSRNSVLAEPGETKAPERVSAALGLSQLCKDLGRYFSPKGETHELQALIATGRNPRMI